MITAPDFSKKQIVFVFFNEGEKMAFSNDNLIVKDKNGKIKFQCTCYRLFLIYAVGHCSLTSALLQKAKKFGFFIALMTTGFRLYSLVGAEKGGNYLLHRKQYEYVDLDIAKHITKNKISNQIAVLKEVRYKSDAIDETILQMNEYLEGVKSASNLQELMAYEGLASRQYFKNHFNNILWTGRKPRIKNNPVNSTLDIGYTLLFTFIDAILECYGFDVYCGVMHRQFYMRKSLVCDLVEPFRPLIDKQIKKSINLRQIKEDDFLVFNKQYKLKWEKSPDYIRFLMNPLIENKDDIFLYIQSYYRAFMKQAEIDEYPNYSI